MGPRRRHGREGVACGARTFPRPTYTPQFQGSPDHMSDLTPPTNASQTAEETNSAQMGTFDESGAYTPRQVVSDDLGTTSFEDAIAGTIVALDDGDIVSGTVVKVDKDEV